MRLDVYQKTKLQECAAKFYLRLQHTNPFPAIVEDGLFGVKDPIYNTYLSCMPQHIRDAMLTLMADERYIDVLDRNQSSSLMIEYQSTAHPEKMVDIAIGFSFSKPRPSASYWNHVGKLDPKHSMQREIIEWVYKAKEINQDYARCREYINTIIEWANTAGQLRTMFPDYIRLLPEYQQQHIAGMKKRSSLPKKADGVYLATHRQFVAEKTALCLLLPEGGEKIWLG